MKYRDGTFKVGLAAHLIAGALALGGMTVAYAATNGGSLPLLSISPTPVQETARSSAVTLQSSTSQATVASTGAPAVSTAQAEQSQQATAGAEPAAQQISSLAVTVAPAVDSLLGLAPTPKATPATSEASQDEAIIEGFPSLAQSYNLSCEYAAAAAVTLYWGDMVYESDFISEVPISPNPHLGFRGDINGTFGGITDYGVYAEPLVPVLEARGYDAVTFYGGVDNLKANLAAGNPVVLWMTTAKYAVSTVYSQSYGEETFNLVPGEHAVVVYGYDSGGVYIMDVANGQFKYTAWDSFLSRWSYFDQMALVITPKQ